MRLTSLGVALLCMSISCAKAEWPERDIKIIVPNNAGSTNDIQVRILAQKLSQRTGKAVVVENKASVDGTLAVHSLMYANPDGYTFLAPTTNMLTPNANYNALSAFSFVSTITVTDLFVVVRDDSPIRTLQELIASKPGEYSIGNPGTRYAGKELERITKIGATEIPYSNGEPAALLAVLTGTVAYSFALGTNLKSAISTSDKQRGLRALAVLSHERSAFFPQVPTIDEAGLASFKARPAVAGLVLPKEAPAGVADKVSALVCEVMNTPATQAAYNKFISKATCSTPAQFRSFAEQLQK